MTGKYPAEKLRKYPHLMVGDIRIWEQYLEVVDHKFDSFDYDVHVGKGVKPSEDWSEDIKTMALALSEKRIDVLAWKDNTSVIIEVKPQAALSAIGQVLCYRELYEQRYPGRVRPLLMILTDFEMPDIRWLCGRFGIRYVVVGVAA